MASSFNPFMGATGSNPANKVPRGYSLGRLQNFTPEQMELFSQMFGNVSPDSFLSRLSRGDQGTFEQMEQPQLREFQQQLGSIGSRFSSMGSGTQRSSGFQNAINQAGSDFLSQLQGRRMDLQRQALQDLFGMSQQLLQDRPYEQFLAQKAPKKKKGWGGLLGSALGGIGGFFAGGPGGAMAGAQLGHQIGGGF